MSFYNYLAKIELICRELAQRANGVTRLPVDGGAVE